MPLYKRGRIWHYEFEIQGKRYRGTTRQTSKAKAKEVEQSERDRITVGGDARKITLGDACKEFWVQKAQHLKSADRTAQCLESIRRHIDFETDVRDIDERIIGEAITARRCDVTHSKRAPSNQTVNREFISTLRPVLKFAAKRMKVKGMPDIDWSELSLAKPSKRIRELTEQEYNDLYKAFAPWHRELFAFYNLYGVRLSEAFFPLDNIDVDGCRIALRDRKAGDWHVIPIRPDDMRAIAAKMSRAKAAGINTIWFRETPDGIAAITPATFKQASKRAIKRAKINDLRSVHDYRHNAAMKALRRSKGNLPAVSAMLGHTDIKTTMIYAHAVEDDVRAALGAEFEKLDISAQKSPQNADDDSKIG